MSKIALSGNVSGSGTLTIAAPNTNSDRTLTLPDNSGTLLSNASTAGFPAGSVLQVVSFSNSTTTSTTSSTYVDVTGYSASITPTSATSKILVRVLPKAYVSFNAERYPITDVKITRNGTQIYSKGYYNYAGRAPNGYVEMQIDFNMEVLDAPATTSSVTYQIQFRTNEPALTSVGGSSTITLMEIAA
jgi:hypothetical protein